MGFEGLLVAGETLLSSGNTGDTGHNTNTSMTKRNQMFDGFACACYIIYEYRIDP